MAFGGVVCFTSFGVGSVVTTPERGLLVAVVSFVRFVARSLGTARWWAAVEFLL
jgi:hypothetical protein